MKRISSQLINENRSRWFLASLAMIAVCLLCSSDAKAAEKPTEEQLRFFETKIRPLLLNSCVDCHSEDLAESDLRLDNLAGMLHGGKAGPALIPGKPASSLIITAIGYQDGTLQMPPDEKLPKSAIADLKRWVEMGAPHPESDQITDTIKKSGVDFEAGRQHWAFQPVQKPEIPQLTATSEEWVKNPIDAFILKSLENQQLQPLAPADKRTLIRRATFDLTGLPPKPEEIDAFLADDSPEAFSTVVNRLLDSPHYGERWGRHWLDVARYADSNGLDENVAHGNAWRYRDYVIESLNNDKPYDQFLQEQLAGDLLNAVEPETDYHLKNERLIATGFLSLGPKVLAEVDSIKMEMDIIDEQLDTVGRSLMGLTLGCARCHDHKFDPVAQADYYAMAGILKSTKTMESFKIVAKWNENEIASPDQQAQKEAQQAKIEAKKTEITGLVASATESLKQRLAPDGKLSEKPETQFTAEEQTQLKTLREEQKNLEANLPVLPTAMSVKEGEAEDIQIHIRGSHLTLGDTVARGFPQVIEIPVEYKIPDAQSGRLELANWLTNKEHPLMPRVMVNRIWRWHFGEGIVTTPDNFGLQGSKPTHPQLLDWLAATFIEKGYSLKEMHRLMMLSSTYQMSSEYDETTAERDPGNVYYWRFNARRLEAESIRDAVLAVAETLDREMGGNLLNVDNRAFVFNHESKENVDYDFGRRSIYLPVIRNHLHPVFSLFDYADASVLNGDRQTSTVATQALFLMNSPFLEEQTTAYANWLIAQESEVPARTNLLYVKSYGRLATTEEQERVQNFLAEFPDVWKSDHPDAEESAVTAATWQALCHAVLAANEFTYLR
ncbi:Planctomycete cytochrome C [Polystyrenella longa]|uniref:Planctomycete cytochrome C n=1 Tax=Polystyrenella longa TaxID=2528007 RepID=A0A518CLU6_9PLAN|nr:PSD1 and planctomycete cytochrome C domain-containing protein [Polystyrenella longa]QDU80173.1 Planctomycete cytochrome C [Polystyrenella longa]